ncbi:PadR family transcriptional regulator [Amnibacterium endophyticum]|uniref:PadR family transcriptional regulator n=1 Tax=Amnibacterium endophyticum TaxID=2109337 RepID=A0ABW4LJG7_9MICO
MSSIRVFLLGSLAERGPMHGHQLRLLAEREHVAMWTDFGVGAIYGALKRLLAEGLVEALRTEREGARPERQIVAITPAGREALDAMRLETLTTFTMKADPFDLAMARLGPEVLDELPWILSHRRGAIADELAAEQQRVERAEPYLTVAERHVMQHKTHRLTAELAWLDAVLADLPAIVADERTREAD